MSMRLFTNNAVEIDGKMTGLFVTQERWGTRVYTPEKKEGGQWTGETTDHLMPYRRYNLAQRRVPGCGIPEGNGSREDFEADVRALLARLETEAA